MGIAELRNKWYPCFLFGLVGQRVAAARKGHVLHLAADCGQPVLHRGRVAADHVQARAVGDKLDVDLLAFVLENLTRFSALLSAMFITAGSFCVTCMTTRCAVFEVECAWLGATFVWDCANAGCAGARSQGWRRRSRRL